jgi:hypothetical protein
MSLKMLRNPMQAFCMYYFYSSTLPCPHSVVVHWAKATRLQAISGMFKNLENTPNLYQKHCKQAYENISQVMLLKLVADQVALVLYAAKCSKDTNTDASSEFSSQQKTNNC